MKRLSIWTAIAMLILSAARAIAQIPNYEGSDILERANAINATDAKRVKRAEIVRLYEEYLEEHPDTINKARVLAQICLLYIFAFDEEKGVPQDLDHGHAYLRRAIEADPDLLCLQTIYARTNLACSAPRGVDRMRARIDVYKWAKDMPDDRIAASVRRTLEAQRFHFGGKSLPADRLEQEIKLQVVPHRSRLDAISETVAVNLVGDARGADMPEAALQEAYEALAGYPAESLVLEALAEVRGDAGETEEQDPKTSAMPELSSWEALVADSALPLMYEGFNEADREAILRYHQNLNAALRAYAATGEAPAVGPDVIKAFTYHLDNEYRERDVAVSLLLDAAEQEPDTLLLPEIYASIGKLYNARYTGWGQEGEDEKEDYYFRLASAMYGDYYHMDICSYRNGLMNNLVRRKDLAYKTQMYDWMTSVASGEHLEMFWPVPSAYSVVKEGVALEPPERYNKRIAVHHAGEVAGATLGLVRKRMVRAATPEELAELVGRYPDDELGTLAKRKLGAAARDEAAENPSVEKAANDAARYMFPDAVTESRTPQAVRAYDQAREGMEEAARRILSGQSVSPEHYDSARSLLSDTVRNYPEDPIAPFCERRIIILDWMAGKESGAKTAEALLALAARDPSSENAELARQFAATVAFRDGHMTLGTVILSKAFPAKIPQFGWFAFQYSKYFSEYAARLTPETGEPDADDYERKKAFADFLEAQLLPKLDAHVRGAKERTYSVIERDQVVGAYHRLAQDAHLVLGPRIYLVLSMRCSDDILPRILEAWEGSLSLLDAEMGCQRKPEHQMKAIAKYEEKVIPKLLRLQGR